MGNKNYFQVINYELITTVLKVFPKSDNTHQSINKLCSFTDILFA